MHAWQVFSSFEARVEAVASLCTNGSGARAVRPLAVRGCAVAAAVLIG